MVLDVDVVNPVGIIPDDLLPVLEVPAGDERLADLQKLLNELNKELEDQAPKIGETFGPIIGESVGQAVSAAIKGEAFDIADFLANAVANKMGQLVEETLNKAVTAALNSFSANQDAAGNGQGFGGSLGNILGAGIVVGGLVAAGLKSTKSDINTGLAKSAVTSVQQTRGLIVGSTSVPVAQIGDNIRDSILPLIEIERTNGQTLLGILAAMRTQRAAGATTDEILDVLLSDEAVGSANL